VRDIPTILGVAGATVCLWIGIFAGFGVENNTGRCLKRDQVISMTLQSNTREMNEDLNRISRQIDRLSDPQQTEREQLHQVELYTARGVFQAGRDPFRRMK
jgi:hypothetical protein